VRKSFDISGRCKLEFSLAKVKVRVLSSVPFFLGFFLFSKNHTFIALVAFAFILVKLVSEMHLAKTVNHGKLDCE